MHFSFVRNWNIWLLFQLHTWGLGGRARTQRSLGIWYTFLLSLYILCIINPNIELMNYGLICIHFNRCYRLHLEPIPLCSVAHLASPLTQLFLINLVESPEKTDYKSFLDTYFNLFFFSLLTAYWWTDARLLLLAEFKTGYSIKNGPGIGKQKPIFSYSGPIIKAAYWQNI